MRSEELTGVCVAFVADCDIPFTAVVVFFAVDSLPQPQLLPELAPQPPLPHPPLVPHPPPAEHPADLAWEAAGPGGDICTWKATTSTSSAP